MLLFKKEGLKRWTEVERKKINKSEKIRKERKKERNKQTNKQRKKKRKKQTNKETK